MIRAGTSCTVSTLQNSAGGLVFLRLGAPAAHLDLLPTPESVRLCILGTARTAELWTTLGVARCSLGAESKAFEDRARQLLYKPGCKQVPPRGFYYIRGTSVLLFMLTLELLSAVITELPGNKTL